MLVLDVKEGNFMTSKTEEERKENGRKIRGHGRGRRAEMRKIWDRGNRRKARRQEN